MAEIFKFFNSAPGDERWHYASDFADYFGDVLSSGLLHKDGTPNLQVKVNVGTMQTYVEAGKALIQGYQYQNTTPLFLAHGLPEANLDRIDRIVLRLDKRNNARFIRLFVKEGVSATNPVPPSLQRDQYVFELSLAQIRLTKNTSSLEPLKLIDERMKEDLCGIVYSLISVPTSVFQQQWDYWFNLKKQTLEDDMEAWQIQQKNDFETWQAIQKQEYLTWIESIKDILDENVAANLAARIADLEQGLANHIAEVSHIKWIETVGGTANALTATIDGLTSYKNGLAVSFPATSNSTAAMTLNINGLGAIPIKKANSTAFSNAMANGVYTVRYRAGAFILQGEGGEYGNAKEGDVVKGVTFGTEQGIKTGTLVAYKAGSAIPSNKVKERFSEKWVKTPINAQGKPFGIDRFGNIYIGYNYLSQVDGRLVKYNKSGQIVKSFTPSGQFGTIMGVDVGGDRVAAVCDDRYTYILDLDLNLIQSIPAGTYFSTHVAVDSLGNTYMQYSDTFEVRSVRKYNPSGLQVGIAQLTNNFNMMQLMATFDNQLVVLTPSSPVASLIKFTFSSYYATKSWETAIKTDVYGQLYQARALDNGRIALATSGNWYNQRRDGPRIITYDANGAEISSVSLNQQYENYSYRWTSRFCLCPDAEGGVITSAGAISYINLSDDTKISFATEIVRRLRVNTYTLEHVGIATSGESNIFGVSWMNYSLEDDLIYYHDTSGRVRCYKKEYVLI
ncbi:hypothetical protein J1907_17750 [Lysinibacillus sphaericus]|uniref:hypothetical protein n=1 Tax=Lysinibacillus sphaericus TaxID=1421 RepID=UPI00068C7786|nr:hypothetical protein [Lysinibacillus sphaericus]QTB21570.1 hypothetical protein J1907_17750 [Lysinibacillus sphaericus]